MDFGFDYASCVRASEKAQWKLDEVMPEGTDLDFERKFLPDALAPTEPLTFLAEAERRALNQIAANSYLNLFAFVEEYILATMTQHAQAEVFGKDPYALRALSRFVDEELKHQMLFQRYRAAFDRGFGHPCEVLENAVEVAGIIMGHSGLAVLMITLHIEQMTQQHYTECVKDEPTLDPLFKSLLRHHWMEEAQHAKIDALELGKLADVAGAERIEKAFDEYLGILDAFDGLLTAQAKMDVRSLSAKLGRSFSEKEQQAIAHVQLQGYRRTFIWYGMTNPSCQAVFKRLSSGKAVQVAERSKRFEGTDLHVA